MPVFPDWSAVAEWPHSVMVFVTEARRIIGYLKHLPEEQKPPRSIWHSPKKCQKWIEDHNPFDKDKAKSQSFIGLDDVEVEL